MFRWSDNLSSKGSSDMAWPSPGIGEELLPLDALKQSGQRRGAPEQQRQVGPCLGMDKTMQYRTYCKALI